MRASRLALSGPGVSRSRHALAAGCAAIALAAAVAAPVEAARTGSLVLRGSGARGEAIEPASGLSGRTFAAAPEETRELLLPDGTSIVIGPGGSLEIEGYSFDPETGVGALSLVLGAGSFRISGGELNTLAPIVARVCDAEIVLDNASAAIIVAPDLSVRTYLLSGKSVVYDADGSAETLFRPGFETGGSCGGDEARTPTRISRATLEADRAALRPPVGSGSDGEEVALVPTVQPDDQVEEGGIATGKLPASLVDQDEVQVEEGGIATGKLPASLVDQDDVVEAGRETVAPPSPPPPPPGPTFDRGAFDTALNEGAALGGTPVELPNATGTSGSITDIDAFLSLSQVTDWVFSGSTANLHPRGRGPTTNRVTGSFTLATVLDGPTQNPALLIDGASIASLPGVRDHLFATVGPDTIVYGFGDGPGSGAVTSLPQFLLDDQFSFGDDGPPSLPQFPFSDQVRFGDDSDLLLIAELPERQHVVQSRNILDDAGLFSASPFLVGNALSLQSGFQMFDIRGFVQGETGVDVLVLEGTGTPFDGLAVADIQNGEFISFGDPTFLNEGALGLAFRAPDNFLFQQLQEVDPASANLTGASLVFAAGDVDGAFSAPSEVRVDRFFTSAGLVGFDDQAAANPGGVKLVGQAAPTKTVADGLRAFLRTETVPQGVSLVDSGVLVANRAGSANFEATPSRDPLVYSGGEVTAQVLHADFGLIGTGTQQRSTLSLTIGTLDRQSLIPGALVERTGLTTTDGFTEQQLAAMDAAPVGTVIAGTDLLKRRDRGSRAEVAAVINAGLDPADQVDAGDVGVPDLFAQVDAGLQPVRIGTVDAGAADVFVDARTFGTTSADATEGPLFLVGDLFSTASGGGNPNLTDAGGAPLTGVPGYFVVENFDPQADSTALDVRGRPLNGGSEIPLSFAAADETHFAALRLLSGAGSLEASFGPNDASPGTVNLGASRGVGGLSGFAAGLSSFQNQPAGSSGEIGVAIADGFADNPAANPLSDGFVVANLALAPNAATNELTAMLSLSDPAGARNDIVLGGLGTGRSAFVDNDTFAAQSQRAGAAGDFGLLTGGLVTIPTADGSAQRLPGIGAVAATPGGPFAGQDLNRIEESPHIAWGLFFGDRIWDPATGFREHVHLGSWVAGDPVERADYASFEGVATYEGHVLGNVFENGATSTVIGRFQNSWNFGAPPGAPPGSFSMDFDGTVYSGDARFKSGRGFVSTNLAAPGRIGRVDGDFYGPVTGSPGSTAAAAVGGQFGISATEGAGQYLASGTFAGGKR